MALRSILLHATARAAQLHRLLFASCVTHKLTRSLLNVASSAGRLVKGTAFFIATVATVAPVAPSVATSSGREASVATSIAVTVGGLGRVRGLVLLANFPQRSDALLDAVSLSDLSKSDLALLLKVLLAHFLLSGRELGDVCVVALLHVLVRALQDGIFLQ